MKKKLVGIVIVALAICLGLSGPGFAQQRVFVRFELLDLSNDRFNEGAFMSGFQWGLTTGDCEKDSIECRLRSFDAYWVGLIEKGDSDPSYPSITCTISVTSMDMTGLQLAETIGGAIRFIHQQEGVDPGLGEEEMQELARKVLVHYISPSILRYKAVVDGKVYEKAWGMEEYTEAELGVTLANFYDHKTGLEILRGWKPTSLDDKMMKANLFILGMTFGEKVAEMNSSSSSKSSSKP